MKKIFAILLVVAMVFVLSACGNLKKIKTAISNLADGEIILDGDDMIKDDSDKDAGKPSKAKGKASYTISNEVLADNEYLTVTVVEGYEGFLDDFVLNLLIENKSDNNIIVTSGETSYNGYMINGYLYLELGPGENADSELKFFGDQIELAEAGVAEEVTFELTAYNSDDNTEPYYLDDFFAVYPTGLDAGSVTYPDRAPRKGETVLIDNEDLKFTIEGVNEDGSWAYEVQVYIENRTDDTLYIRWTDESINGFMVYSYWGEIIYSGMKNVGVVQFSKDSLEKNGIDKVEEIEFYLKAYKENLDDVIYGDTFVFNP